MYTCNAESQPVFPLLVDPDVGQAHATSLGPWVPHGLLRLPPRPPRPAPGPPLPLPGVNLLMQSLRELTRRIVLCSQRKEGNSHRRTAEGPRGGGAGAKGPGGPASAKGNCRRVEYIIGWHIGKTNVFCRIPILCHFPCCLQPTA